MREHGLSRRLARLLPAHVAREVYAPALADLTIEGLERRHSFLTHTCRVMWLWLGCLRLAALEQLRRGREHRNPDRRKESFPMLLRDLRRATRVFHREPAFAATAVVTLMLGIGANTALFAVVEAVLLRPLPVPAADDVIVLRHRDVPTGVSKPHLAIGDVLDMRERQQTLEALAPYGGMASTLFDAAEPMRVEGLGVSPEMFRALRLTVAMGRSFTPEDARQGAAPVVIVSHELWQTALGSDPQILSRSIQLGAQRRQVVGVLPPGFHFPPGARTDLLVPFPLPAAPPANRKAGWIFALGRMKAGVSHQDVARDFARLSVEMADEHPDQNRGTVYETPSLREALVGDTRRPLLLLLAAVACVLLIACANVGNLLLARALARQSEFGMRLALGAGRGRVMAQIFSEGLVLACVGGLLGMLAAWRLAPAIAALVPQGTAIPTLTNLQLNGWVLGFSLAVSLLSAVVFSAVAFMAVTRTGARAALVSDRRLTAPAGARHAASTLVAAEIALAMVLLLGAGLTLRSFANLMSVDPGFRPAGVLTMQVGLPAGRYPDPLARRALYERMFAAIGSAPMVDVVGAAAVTPLTGNNWIVTLQRPEQPLPAGQRPPEVGWQAASKGYFEALGIPLRAGRLFNERDLPEGPPVVIISDALAARHFPNEDPVGQRVQLGDGTAEIVGVVGSIRRASLADAPREDMYFPFEQALPSEVTLFIRTSGGSPADAVPAVRAAIRDSERHIVVHQVRSLDAIAAESAGVTRLAMQLLGGFALIALVLAGVGIYGVVAYSVRRRTRELGTRVALGATRADIVRLVMRQALIVVAAGLVAGVVVGLLAARLLSSLLFNVPPSDVVAISVAAVVLATTALMASYVPARRAARIDPTTALAAD
jgi:putative ABC transport system permease protein